MISRIEGTLESVSNGLAELRAGPVTFHVMVPGADEQRLAHSRGEAITLHVLLYFESHGQGANMLPRMIGFSTARDRAFFELFTTVKGMGNRKALRALQLPFAEIAAAIAARDVDLLKSLPEIGKRTAETIVAELDGKVERFIDHGIRDDPDHHAGESTATATDPERKARRLMADGAVSVLVSLGESRLLATQLVRRAMDADPEIRSADEIITAAYRLRELPA
ncbi:MAG: Holliday junction branch migration protein RuvA [Phycisphaerales bacterium]